MSIITPPERRDAGHDTGRLTRTLHPEAHQVVYGAPNPAADLATLRLTSRIDRVHVLGLRSSGLLTVAETAQLLDAIQTVEALNYAPVLERPRPRGLYLVYEQVISELAGPGIGGKLHTGRSRNDLNATVAILMTREGAERMVADGIRLLAALLGRAEKYAHAVMPIHTHSQPAMPITYGYYLTGVALALARDLAAVGHAAFDHDVCPLGAHAVAGTNVPLNTKLTARLLGFGSGPMHAVDSIASRDTSVRTLSAATLASITVSRLAADLQFWSTQEAGFVAFPDWLVGSSSAMPQKRNAFLLEHLKARPAQVLGALVAACTAEKAAPFTNSIEVGTEAMARVMPALDEVCDLLRLASLVVAGAQPVPDRMLGSATRGFVGATAAANRLVAAGVPFREAHHVVGAAVRDAVVRGETRLDLPEAAGDAPELNELVAEARFGGGPGALEAAMSHAHQLRQELVRWLRDRTRRQDLDLKVMRVLLDAHSVGKEGSA